jgi:DNA adenine methylase
MIRSPFKWVGGKSRLRKTIISILPPHDCYVEVFGGAGWVLLGKKPCKVEIFNDIDGEVVNFFRVVKNTPKELLKSFEWELVSRQKFEQLRDAPVEELNDIQRAHRFYYLIMAAWGGELGNPRFQTSISDGGHGNRLIGALKDLHKRILPVHKRLKTVIIENLRWQECIKRYDRPYEKKRIVMYLDPPYPENKVNYKFNMRQLEEHEKLVEILLSLKSLFVLTIYDLPEIHDLYSHNNFQVNSVDYAAGMPTNNNQRSRNREIIVTNFDASEFIAKSQNIAQLKISLKEIQK